MKSVHLLVLGGAKRTQLSVKLPSTVGRGRSANLTVPHPLVSRLHCKFFVKKGRLAIRDLGSLNGTFVNNQRIDRDLLVSPGDVIRIGDIELRALAGADEAARDLAYEASEDREVSCQAAKTQTIQETVRLDEELQVASRGWPNTGEMNDVDDDAKSDLALTVPAPNNPEAIRDLQSSDEATFGSDEFDLQLEAEKIEGRVPAEPQNGKPRWTGEPHGDKTQERHVTHSAKEGVASRPESGVAAQNNGTAARQASQKNSTKRPNKPR